MNFLWYLPRLSSSCRSLAASPAWICFCWWFFYGSHGMHRHFSPPFGRNSFWILLPTTYNKQIWRYCWWTKSCTTKDDNYPIIYRVLTIPSGCLGFLNHQQYYHLNGGKFQCFLVPTNHSTNNDQVEHIDMTDRFSPSCFSERRFLPQKPWREANGCFQK